MVTAPFGVVAAAPQGYALVGAAAMPHSAKLPFAILHSRLTRFVSLSAGATLGSAFAGAAHMVTAPFGVVAAAPQGYALVGVAAMLAANCQVPLTAVLLLFELTQDYYVILPTLGAVGISYWVASLPGATSAFTPSKFQESDQNSGGPVEDSGYMDALKITSQLGLDVAGEVDLPESGKAETNPALADFGKFGQREVVSIGSNGSSKEVAIDPAYRDAAKNQLLNSMDTNAETLEGVSVACALEEACVLLSTDTSMTEALSIMDEVDQKVALVTNEEGAVVGVLTRESIVKQLARSPNASVQKITD